MANYTNMVCTITLATEDTVGAAADATTLKAYLVGPGRGEVIYQQGVNGTWTHPSTGSYTFAFTPDVVGQWRVGFTAQTASWVSTNNVVVDVTALRPVEIRGVA